MMATWLSKQQQDMRLNKLNEVQKEKLKKIPDLDERMEAWALLVLDEADPMVDPDGLGAVRRNCQLNAQVQLARAKNAATKAVPKAASKAHPKAASSAASANHRVKRERPRSPSASSSSSSSSSSGHPSKIAKMDKQSRSTS